MRRNNMSEVALGYTAEQARLEAMRCLQCKNAPCIKGCPVCIDIPAFLAAAAEGNFQKSIDIIKQNSLLPAVCGRVCPQEVQCQLPCTVGKSLKSVDKAVSIGRIERFIADLERESGKLDQARNRKKGRHNRQRTGKYYSRCGCASRRSQGHHVRSFP